MKIYGVIHSNSYPGEFYIVEATTVYGPSNSLIDGKAVWVSSTVLFNIEALSNKLTHIVCYSNQDDIFEEEDLDTFLSNTLSYYDTIDGVAV